MKKRSAKISYTAYGSTPYKQLLPLFLIIFIDSFGYFLILPVLLRLFMNDAASILPASTTSGMRDLLYSVTVALSPLAFLLVSPVIGHFSDKYGRKKTMLFCLASGLVGYLLPVLGILNRSVSLILIGRFVAGASTASQPVAQAAITDFSQGRKKAFYLALIGFAMTLAMVLGPTVGSYASDPQIESWFSSITPYWIGIGLSLLNIVLLMAFFFDRTQVLNHEKPLPLVQYLAKVKALLSGNRLYALMLVFLFLELAWSQYYQSIFLFLSHQFKYSTDQSGLFSSYVGLWMSLGLTVIYRIAIRFFAVSTILKMSLLIATLGLIGCSIPSDATTQWIFVAPLAICVGTAYPSLLSLMSDRAPVDQQGLVLGSASTVLGGTWMITAFLSGPLTHVMTLLPIIAATLFMLIALALVHYATATKPTHTA